MLKKAVFFSIDILVAIVLVFIFSSFVLVNLSYSYSDSQFPQIQLVSYSQDYSVILQHSPLLDLTISGSESLLVDSLDTLFADNVCISVYGYLNSVETFSAIKTSCVEADEFIVNKFPYEYLGNTYVIEVKTWVQ